MCIYIYSIYITCVFKLLRARLCKCETCCPGRSSLQIVGDLRHRVSLFGTQTFVISIQSIISDGTEDAVSFDPRGWSSCFVPMEFQSLRTASLGRFDKGLWYSRAGVVKGRSFADTGQGAFPSIAGNCFARTSRRSRKDGIGGTASGLSPHALHETA